MSKHTPGPWRVAGEQGVQIRSERDQIAKVWTMRGNEWKANACLIAAAPVLLAELIEAADFIESMGMDATPARTAIAKATGAQL